MATLTLKVEISDSQKKDQERRVFDLNKSHESIEESKRPKDETLNSYVTKRVETMFRNDKKKSAQTKGNSLVKDLIENGSEDQIDRAIEAVEEIRSE